MDKYLLGSVVFVVGLVLVIGEVNVESEMIFNGVRYCCINSCVVNVDFVGVWKVMDCCGGCVRIVFQII